MADEPQYGSDRFQCPRCGAFSQQIWFDQARASKAVSGLMQSIYLDYRVEITDYQQETIVSYLSRTEREFPVRFSAYVPSQFAVSSCLGCNGVALWIDKGMVFPRKSVIAPPNSDMNAEIQALYREAANIYPDSAKGAAALLRLALQKLLAQLGMPGENINEDIKRLVKDGLSTKIQKALDLLRVVGNNAVHPGEIRLDDNKEVALRLFSILNLIADEMITKPKEIDELYEKVIPSRARSAIETRDLKNDE